MLILQVLLLSFLAFAVTFLRDFNKTDTAAFWVFCLISYAVYFYACQTNPGYVTQSELNIVLTAKGNAFSEERSVSFSVEVPEMTPTSKSTAGIKGFTQENNSNLPQNFHVVKGNEIVHTNRSEDEEEEEKEDSQNHGENGQVEDIQITEIRHCTICRIDQPIRTKHCRECGKCIATHDHHCPWLGICIGEKNKKVFYSYLVLQFAQLIWALTLVIFYLEYFEFPKRKWDFFLVSWQLAQTNSCTDSVTFFTYGRLFAFFPLLLSQC